MDREEVSGRAEDSEISRLPELTELHERHTGLTEEVGRSYAQAASVCLSRHHEPPTVLEVRHGESRSERQVTWAKPDDRIRRAWANEEDATRDGAYSISIAAVEVECGFRTIGRAETRTGADYIVAPPDRSDDFEDGYRLEISGTDSGGVEARLRQKVRQVRQGIGTLPALACVVGFATRKVAIETIEETDDA